MIIQESLAADKILRRAYFSQDCRYRYRLERTWNPERGWVLFVMLNPSFADGLKDDNTITKCIRFARDWGYGGLTVGNLFAFRSRRPEKLYREVDPIGPENNATLAALRDTHDTTICAWGNNGPLERRDEVVFNLLTVGGKQVHCLCETVTGNPCHPRNVPYGISPMPWGGPRGASR